jgi:L-ribulose-5-phosphate 3-epimerase UlaE
MDKEEIFEMVIREMTENALSSRRENLDEGEQQLYTEVGSLSSQARDIVKELPEEKKKILIDYFEKTNMVADHECAYLYVQGAKDCVELLKKLGVL